MKPKLLLSIVSSLLILTGCNNIGNAPEGMSPDEANKAIKALPIEKQIELIKSAPIPQSEKDKKIAELQAQQGK